MVGYTVCTNEKTVPCRRTNTAVYTVNENHRTYDITVHTSLSISLE